MGVLGGRDYQEVMPACEAKMIGNSIDQVANKKKNSQLTDLFDGFNREARTVEQLLHNLDSLLEPIYYNGPVAESKDCADEGFYGSTNLNQQVAGMADTMRGVRRKLEAIIANINLV